VACRLTVRQKSRNQQGGQTSDTYLSPAVVAAKVCSCPL